MGAPVSCLSVGSGDVVDVGVGDDDLLDGEAMLLQEGDDAGDLVAGVDDDGFAEVSSPRMEQLHWRRPTGGFRDHRPMIWPELFRFESTLGNALPKAAS